MKKKKKMKKKEKYENRTEPKTRGHPISYTSIHRNRRRTERIVILHVCTVIITKTLVFFRYTKGPNGRAGAAAAREERKRRQYERREKIVEKKKKIIITKGNI